jgi:hypothetical protein
LLRSSILESTTFWNVGENALVGAVARKMFCHALATAAIYRIPMEEAVDKNAPRYKERRAIAKNCSFGAFFGLFPKELQRC